MISAREVTTVRIEIDFKVLIGELPQLERDWRKMSLEQFLNVWEPELIDRRGMLYLLKEEKDGRQRVKNRSNTR